MNKTSVTINTYPYQQDISIFMCVNIAPLLPDNKKKLTLEHDDWTVKQEVVKWMKMWITEGTLDKNELEKMADRQSISNCTGRRRQRRCQGKQTCYWPVKPRSWCVPCSCYLWEAESKPLKGCGLIKEPEWVTSWRILLLRSIQLGKKF